MRGITEISATVVQPSMCAPLVLVLRAIDSVKLIIGSFFFFSSRRRHTRYWRDWSSDVCSSDLTCALRRAHPEVRVTILHQGQRLKFVQGRGNAGGRKFLPVPAHDAVIGADPQIQIGRASCRERV